MFLLVQALDNQDQRRFSDQENSGCYKDAERVAVRSKRLDWRTQAKITALVVSIKGLSTMNVHQIACVMPELYQHIEDAAAAHGATVAEKRWDSFILKSDEEDEDSSPAETGCGCRRRRCTGETVGQMLALAADLDGRLQSTQALQLGGLTLSMGIAWGSMTLLGSGFGASWTSCSAVGVRGDAADLAEEMAGVGAVGAVMVHESAFTRWAAAARCEPPASEPVSASGGGGRGRAAAFDFVWGRFRPSACFAVPAPTKARRLCRSASYA